MVTRQAQLQVERRTGKVRRPKTDVDVLPLYHATNGGGLDCGPWTDQQVPWPKYMRRLVMIIRGQVSRQTENLLVAVWQTVAHIIGVKLLIVEPG